MIYNIFTPGFKLSSLKFFKELGPDKVRRHNRELTLWARKTLSQAWETELPAPQELIGSMACIQAPGPWKGTQSEADGLHDRLWEEVRVEVPVFPFADTLWVRISAQLYNERYHYLCLAEVLRP